MTVSFHSLGNSKLTGWACWCATVCCRSVARLLGKPQVQQKGLAVAAVYLGRQHLGCLLVGQSRLQRQVVYETRLGLQTSWPVQHYCKQRWDDDTLTDLNSYAWPQVMNRMLLRIQLCKCHVGIPPSTHGILCIN